VIKVKMTYLVQHIIKFKEALAEGESIGVNAIEIRACSVLQKCCHSRIFTTKNVKVTTYLEENTWNLIHLRSILNCRLAQAELKVSLT
jgi:hypothetical protein